ncbi:PaaI family thioesterase [Nocardioides sp.]|uniref:PaaI family thioesterase n=1 Tax=Nocardioides sp. TaxID=35761 RepID=UPI00271B26BB|nr:PaaI family thioesterase [Nocardioides sp.]MDO9457412.1 PaaI family thioesterase [Nocardioides sp.]
MADAPDAQALRARIAASFDRQGLMTTLGATLAAVAPGEVRIELPYGPGVTQQLGYFHAGATSAIADSAGGYAALTLMPEGTEVLTVEYKINLTAPAVGEHLDAIGTVLKSGRTLSVVRFEVVAVTGDDRTTVALGQQTLIRIGG